MLKGTRVTFYLYMTKEKQIGSVVLRMSGGEPTRGVYDSPREAIQDHLRTYGVDCVFVQCMDGTARGANHTKRVKGAVIKLWEIMKEKGSHPLPVDLVYRYVHPPKQRQYEKKRRVVKRKIELNPKRRVGVLWRDRPELNK